MSMWEAGEGIIKSAGVNDRSAGQQVKVADHRFSYTSCLFVGIL